MGNPLLPVYKGELSASALGMKVEIWDSDGKDIQETGQPGDLIITKPFLSMPITFWSVKRVHGALSLAHTLNAYTGKRTRLTLHSRGEGGEQKYKEAYFTKFPGVWHHGDFLRRNPVTGGYQILGRSDGVLNPGGLFTFYLASFLLSQTILILPSSSGVLFGTADLYSVTERFVSHILDCIVVGQRRAHDTEVQVLMFLKLSAGVTLDSILAETIGGAIASAYSARHVPRYLIQVQDIPYTFNGKKVENVIRDIVNGRELKGGGTVENSACLAEYQKYQEIEKCEGKFSGSREKLTKL
jgi:acetoacetyl-CoA synthetase